MSEMKWLERMREFARTDQAPTIDVTQSVTRRLRARQRGIEAPLAIMAGVSAIAACVVAALAVSAWSEWQDPLSTLLSSLNVVLQ